MKLKVRDMQGDKYDFILRQEDVDSLNEDYQEEFDYYFIEYQKEVAYKLYGSYGALLDSDVYFVADL